MSEGAEEDLAERKMRFLFALRSRGLTDARVLSAMERIDRAAFVRGIFSERREQKGFFQRIRRNLGWLLMLSFIAIPWVQYNGQQTFC